MGSELLASERHTGVIRLDVTPEALNELADPRFSQVPAFHRTIPPAAVTARLAERARL
jgi:hypothetical protein